MSAMEQEIRSFIEETFILTDEKADLAADQSLMELGIIDSTGVFALIDFLEESYGISIKDSEIIPENLDSITQITAFIGRKKGSDVAAAG